MVRASREAPEFDHGRAIRADAGATEIMERLLSLSVRYGFIPRRETSGMAPPRRSRMLTAMPKRFGVRLLARPVS